MSLLLSLLTVFPAISMEPQDMPICLLSAFYPLSDFNPGVKEITEKGRDGWKNISYYDEHGFLIKITHFYKSEKRSENRFEYSVCNDTLVVINYSERYRSETKYAYNNHEKVFIGERVTSLSDEKAPEMVAQSDNFTYVNGLLTGFERNDSKVSIQYDEYGRMSVYETVTYYDDFLGYRDWEGIETKKYTYDNEGRLTGIITVTTNRYRIGSENTGELPVPNYLGVVSYAKDYPNKYWIRYSSYDKRDNWRKSSYMTEKGEVKNKTRHIKYW